MSKLATFVAAGGAGLAAIDLLAGVDMVTGSYGSPTASRYRQKTAKSGHWRAGERRIRVHASDVLIVEVQHKF
jgi:hypothetical protein